MTCITNPMRIELLEQYKFKRTFTSNDLPDIAVLVGRNGAGKIQLREAVWNKKRNLDVSL